MENQVILSKLKEMQDENRKQFKQMDEQFTHMDKQFTRMDVQFTRMDSQFESVHARFKKVEDLLNGLVGEVKLITEDESVEIGLLRERLENVERKIYRLSKR